MFLAMTVAVQYIVYLEYCRSKSHKRRIPLARDVSQSYERQGDNVFQVGCLTGSSEHYLFADAAGASLWRRLLGEEAMALQGLTIHHFPKVRSSFSHELLCDLAGNAFNLPCFIVVAFALLSCSESEHKSAVR